MAGPSRRALIASAMAGAALIGVGGCGGAGRGGDAAREALAAWRGALDAGDHAAALEIARQLQASQPERRDGWLMEARVHDARWDLEAEAAALRAAYARGPEGFPALTELVYAMGHTSTPGPESEAAWRGLLSEHLARYPADRPEVLRAHLTRLTARLNQPGGAQRRRAGLTEELAGVLEQLQQVHGERAEVYYREAEALLLLGREDEALAAMAAGRLADGDTWDALTLRMGYAFALIHRGRADEAWAEMEAYLERYAAWPGHHFAMRMPMAGFLQLTARLRYDRDLPLPSGLVGRPEAAAAAGVAAQYGTDDIRRTVRALLEALDGGGVAARIEDLLILLGRDRGCVTETRIVRPHLTSLLLARQGDQLASVGQDPSGAYRRARALFPGDAWLRAREAAALRGFAAQ